MEKSTSTFVRFGNEIICLEAIVGMQYYPGECPSLAIALTTEVWNMAPENVAAAWEYFSSQITDRASITEPIEEEPIDWGVVNAGLSKVQRGSL